MLKTMNNITDDVEGLAWAGGSDEGYDITKQAVKRLQTMDKIERYVQRLYTFASDSDASDSDDDKDAGAELEGGD